MVRRWVVVVQRRVVEAFGRSYHAGRCFHCAHCKRCLDDLPFTLDVTNRFYCLPDYNKSVVSLLCNFACQHPIGYCLISVGCWKMTSHISASDNVQT